MSCIHWRQVGFAVYFATFSTLDGRINSVQGSQAARYALGEKKYVGFIVLDGSEGVDGELR
ncbi:MAG: hypothetical protein KJ558_12565 [Gammaproteobacteria bacterium]|nr:hypothetical protein [Gammaproteobacteria bacterium]MBU1655636.1 hypothetical protein [Gammaproteobacteria bacterium]MBU1960289.1 hypothetical protein [Gammaproteobacteria bacterium]